MFRTSWIAAAATALFMASPAVAGVDISPDPWSPKIHFKATKSQPAESRASTQRGEKPAKKRWPYSRYLCNQGDDGLWVCEPVRGEPRESATLTPGEILQAVREIGLPRLDVTIEPGDTTLVNADTNFYTDPEAFARSIDLLGFDVDLQASPVRYTWIHGDGTRHATAKPGRPYPDLDVTHRYREPAEVVRPRVDVTYRVRYRVDGGAWATLGQTLTASGPTTDLAVNEAAPVLTAP